MTAHAADDKRGLPGEPRGDSAALGHAINPLQRLIRQRLHEQGWSYGEVARRGGLPRSTVYTLATTRNLVRPPRPATIDALAKGAIKAEPMITDVVSLDQVPAMFERLHRPNGPAKVMIEVGA